MNEYGQTLYDHFSRHDPDSVAALPDPEAHFTTLGRAAAVEIATLMEREERQLGLEESSRDHRGRLSVIRGEIESMVLTRIVATEFSADAPQQPGGRDPVAHFRDHAGRLATYFSEGGLGL